MATQQTHLEQKYPGIVLDDSPLTAELDTARQRRDYEEADRIRAELESQGYVVMTDGDGTKVIEKWRFDSIQFCDRLGRQYHTTGDAVTRRTARLLYGRVELAIDVSLSP